MAFPVLAKEDGSLWPRIKKTEVSKSRCATALREEFKRNRRGTKKY
jgi:hypothetical protein